MSNIPVGSPQVPPGRHAAPGGWYPDPVDPAFERYWDGWQWSRNTRPRPGGPAPAYGAASAPGAAFHQSSPPGSPIASGTYPAAYRPVPRTADGVPLAGWWWRVLAAVLDGLIIGVVGGIIGSPIYLRLFRSVSAQMTEAVRQAQTGQPPTRPFWDLYAFSARDQLTLVAIGLGVGLAYHILFLRWKSATPGKLATGLRVVPVDVGRNSAPLGWGRLAIRALVWLLPAASAYLLLLRVADALWPLWHPKRQALHDLAAQTQVVKVS